MWGDKIGRLFLRRVGRPPCIMAGETVTLQSGTSQLTTEILAFPPPTPSSSNEKKRSTLPISLVSCSFLMRRLNRISESACCLQCNRKSI